jgi:hypothetical protein
MIRGISVRQKYRGSFIWSAHMSIIRITWKLGHHGGFPLLPSCTFTVFRSLREGSFFKLVCRHGWSEILNSNARPCFRVDVILADARFSWHRPFEKEKTLPNQKVFHTACAYVSNHDRWEKFYLKIFWETPETAFILTIGLVPIFLCKWYTLGRDLLSMVKS